MIKTLAKPRSFISEDLDITWEQIEPIFQNLLNREINDVQALEKWLVDRSELEAVLQEDYAWRYIRMTCDTSDEALGADFQYFATEIEPKIAPINNALDQKLVASPFIAELQKEGYPIYFRKVKKALEIFREENIPLFTEIQLKQQNYQTIVGALMVEIDGKEYTLQQAAALLQEPDRDRREQVWRKINAVRLTHKDALNELFNELLSLRHQVALNAGFNNFRDYMFAAMGRFDYSVDDCLQFHDAVAENVVPVLQNFAQIRKDKLKVSTLRPWDMAVDPDNKAPLKPFADGAELISKTEEAFGNLHPYMGKCIATMRENGLFDVESKKGKAPGGYNYPLAETGAPFIFMNAAGTLRDLTTMVHEGGHAIHTFISADLALTEFKSLPSEVAELASMSMELISMDQWHLFFPNPEDLKRAKQEQLEDAISTLPWVATVDKFQHWLYTNPGHTLAERNAAWLTIFREFGHGFADWTSLEEAETYLWHKQLHIFEVPFYYIEYGFAQLGAIAVWKNYLQNKPLGLTNYLAALKLGYTQTIPEIYRVAGVNFDFSKRNIDALIGFLQQQLKEV
ncbi:M3 family oligoendopeptidase [Sphingobacterium sp. Mn56C]|uniref:M3 family oligoendopeptidase n=1 Tax=Sphingobacterium sp. Mn56C TaxID=3395261 RepID=UPI003BBB0551